VSSVLNQTLRERKIETLLLTTFTPTVRGWDRDRATVGCVLMHGVHNGVSRETGTQYSSAIVSILLIKTPVGGDG
jgi:hypothetical protein